MSGTQRGRHVIRISSLSVSKPSHPNGCRPNEEAPRCFALQSQQRSCNLPLLSSPPLPPLPVPQVKRSTWRGTLATSARRSSPPRPWASTWTGSTPTPTSCTRGKTCCWRQSECDGAFDWSARPARCLCGVTGRARPATRGGAPAVMSLCSVLPRIKEAPRPHSLWFMGTFFRLTY